MGATTGFRFRLERVLDLKRRAEEDAARHLGIAERAHAEAVRRRDALVAEEEAARARRHEEGQSGEARIGTLHTVQRLADDVARHRRDADQAVVVSLQGVEQARAEVIVAARARQVLENLKDRQAALYRDDEARAEQHVMDEVARLRWRPALGGSMAAEADLVPPEHAGADADPDPSPGIGGPTFLPGAVQIAGTLGALSRPGAVPTALREEPVVASSLDIVLPGGDGGSDAAVTPAVPPDGVASGAQDGIPDGHAARTVADPGTKPRSPYDPPPPPTVNRSA